MTSKEIPKTTNNHILKNLSSIMITLSTTTTTTPIIFVYTMIYNICKIQFNKNAENIKSRVIYPLSICAAVALLGNSISITHKRV